MQREVRIDSFKLWCWRRLLRIPWTARRTNKSVIEELKHTHPLESLIKKLQLSYFGHIMRSENTLEKVNYVGIGWRCKKERQTTNTLSRLRECRNKLHTHRTTRFSKISKCVDEDDHGTLKC